MFYLMTLITFYLFLYGVRHMVKDHLDSERGNSLLPHVLLFLIRPLKTHFGYELVPSACSFVVRAFAHGAMGHRIDPSWWTHWAISRSSQYHTTGVTKAVVCVILSVG